MNWRDVLEGAALRHPDKTAFSFRGEDGGHAGVLTYAGLDSRARAIGARLLELGLAGRPVLLLFPAGLDYVSAFFGCLYAGVIAVPAYPPTRHPRSLERVTAILADSGADTALTTTALAGRLTPRLAAAPALAALHLVTTDDVAPAPFAPPSLAADAIAFLQYTSGSTATPRGVVLDHANLLANTALIGRLFGLDENLRGVSWLPMYHDMGLIGSVLGTVRCGGTMTLTAPATFARDPFRWLELISEERATASGGPNFAYDLCSDRITEEQRSRLDLSSWSVAYNGAEPLRPATLARFADTFAANGFRRSAFLPCYGLAEASLIVTAEPVGAGFRTTAGPSGAELVASGEPPAEQRLEIVDPQTAVPRPDGEVGEVWIAGPSVARGYWNRPDDGTFGARLAGTDGPQFLRTGDLGLLRDGTLYLTGRSKDLIIVRGRNHYPQDIEQSVEQVDPMLRAHGGAAFAVRLGDGEEHLVLVHELRGHDDDTDLEALAARVRAEIAERHEVRPHAVVLIRQSSLPRTSSGKVARHACREAFLGGTLLELARVSDESASADAGARTETGEDVVAVLRAEIAAELGVPADTVPTDRPLVQLGLDSLGAVTVQHRLQTRLGTVIEDALYSSIEELAASAREVTTDDAPADEIGDHPLSDAQRAMWFLHQLAPAGAAYLIAGAAEVRGALDPDALRRAADRLAQRHAALRTTFPTVGDGPVQRVHAQLPPAFEVLDDGDPGELAHRPLDVADGPLLRFSVVRREPGLHHLVLTVHHLVADLWSVEVLLRELGELYREETGGRAAALPPATGFPTALARRAAELEPTTDTRWDFWRERLAGVPVALDLPTDRQRPPEQRFRGGAVRFTVPAEVSAALAELGRAAGTTLYTVLLSAYQVLLARYTGQRDLVVGSPVHGRPDARLGGVVGSFVNTVPLRATIDPAAGFRTLLAAAATDVPAALAHGDLPFATLVQRAQVPRDPSRSPLVQALFTLQGGLGAFAVGAPDGRLELGDLELRPLPLPGAGAQMDLQLSFAETDTGLAGLLQYDAELFDESTVERMGEHLRRVLATLAVAPDTPVGLVPLLGEADRGELLTSGTGPATPYRRDLPVHERVAEQARLTPHAPAVAFDDLALTAGEPASPERLAAVPTLTYAELDAAANRLAQHLLGRGVRDERIVAVHLPRSLDLAVALLAVLKAGGTYLPVDPDLPPDRKRLMVADSGAALVLTHAALADAVRAPGVPVLCYDTVRAEVAAEPATAPDVVVPPENAAYVLYTSGSTGRPKGVHIQHASFVNFLTGMAGLFGPAARGRVLAISRFSFDISGLDLYLPLVLGGTAHIVATSVGADGDQLRARLDSGLFTLLQATPTSWQLLFDAGWRGTPGLTMLSGAEALPPALAKRLLGTRGTLWNLYGPTETTVWSAALEVSEEDARIAPVGPAVANTRLAVLDDAFEPVPPGVAGELCIGGDGLARGYLNRPGLTAEKFVPDPHSPVPGARMYRTGDLAKVLPGGAIEFLGRKDNQVKVNGHRIELGEIEAALGRHPAVRRAVLTVQPSAVSPVLVAYVQPRNRIDAAAFDRQVSNRALREALRESLPPYMVPAHFVWLSEFPLTPSGKIDRKALPEPEIADAAQHEPPATDTERKVAGIVLELLDAAAVGRKENLFDLGANSLMVSRLSVRVRETFGVQLSLHRLFEELTIERVAGHVETEHSTPVAAPVTKVDRSRYAVTAERPAGLRSRRLRRAAGESTPTPGLETR
ncbi:amino acid adenylation domain-containing protein [Amycolatopsis sp. NPDC047767]|uniref:amino acid adenylation domain-containing protein n=1 Tax=Amycolatopsis sp. NPDC047767 TaxID=3156765 RepID=UPI003455A825